MRNVLSRVPKASTEVVAAAVRTIFAQPDEHHVRPRLGEVIRMLEDRFPDIAAMLDDAAEYLLAFTNFPQAHWRKGLVHELSRACQRRDQAPHQRRRDLPQRRLTGPARHRRLETHDEWAVAERRYLPEESRAKLYAQAVPET